MVKSRVMDVVVGRLIKPGSPKEPWLFDHSSRLMRACLEYGYGMVCTHVHFDWLATAAGFCNVGATQQLAQHRQPLTARPTKWGRVLKAGRGKQILYGAICSLADGQCCFSKRADCKPAREQAH